MNTNRLAIFILVSIFSLYAEAVSAAIVYAACTWDSYSDKLIKSGIKEFTLEINGDEGSWYGVMKDGEYISKTFKLYPDSMSFTSENPHDDFYRAHRIPEYYYEWRINRGTGLLTATEFKHKLGEPEDAVRSRKDAGPEQRATCNFSLMKSTTTISIYCTWKNSSDKAKFTLEINNEGSGHGVLKDGFYVGENIQIARYSIEFTSDQNKWNIDRRTGLLTVGKVERG
jgi:hypothetical protein